MNQVIIIGRLTKDVDVQTAASGTSFTKFSLAENDAYDRDHTNFFQCTAFGKQAENMGRFLKQGSRICVTGKVKLTNKDDKYYTDISISHVEFLESREEQNAKPKTQMGQPLNVNELKPAPKVEQQQAAKPAQKKSSGIDYDDIPWNI